MVIVKTASRNVVSKATKIGNATLDLQLAFLTREMSAMGSSLDNESMEDLEHNANLCYNFQSCPHTGG